MVIHNMVIFAGVLLCIGMVYCSECPQVPSDTVGICVEMCSHDSNCTIPGFKCCSNSCGHVCTDARCLKGTPLRTQLDQDMFCGSGPEHMNCPHMYNCMVDQAESTAVCCECDGASCDDMDPCEHHQCAHNETCMKNVVQCIRAPCPPMAECKVCTNSTMCPCMDKECEDDETCMVIRTECDNEPCPLEAKCQNTICQEKMVIGPCEAHMTRYHFDLVAGECKEFIYGGCDGNNNNFETADDCAKKCSVIGTSEGASTSTSHMIITFCILIITMMF